MSLEEKLTDFSVSTSYVNICDLLPQVVHFTKSIHSKLICKTLRFVAFLATEYDEVLSGYQLGQMFEC